MAATTTPPQSLCQAIRDAVGCSVEQAHDVAAFYLDEGIAWFDMHGRPHVRRSDLQPKPLLNAVAIVASGFAN